MSEFRAMWRAQGGIPPLQLWLVRLCIACAALGGAAIFAAALTVTLSVALRTLGLGGIRGDFELVEITASLCASLFLPLCQLKRGHVLVDLFTNWLPFPSRHRLDGLWTALFALAWAYVSWRLFEGMLEIHDYGDKTMLLAIVLAARFGKPLPIVLGILVATLANHGIAAFLGQLIGAGMAPELPDADHNTWAFGLRLVVTPLAQ